MPKDSYLGDLWETQPNLKLDVQKNKKQKQHNITAVVVAVDYTCKINLPPPSMFFFIGSCLSLS